MEQPFNNEELLSRYLLGQLSEEEQERIEQKYIADGDFLDQLLVVEDDLIDAYVRGAIGEADRSAFDNHFLRSPARRKRVQFAEALMILASKSSKAKAAARNDYPQQPRITPGVNKVWVLLPLAAAILVMLCGSWLLVQTMRLRNQVEREQAGRVALESERQDMQRQLDEERKRNEELSERLAQSQIDRREPDGGLVRRPATGTVSFLLTPGFVRGAGDAKKLLVPPTARAVGLEIRLRQSDYKSYRAELRNVEGQKILERDGLKPRTVSGGNVIILTVPADALAPADYIITLTGVSAEGKSEVVNEYPLTVVKK